MEQGLALFQVAELHTISMSFRLSFRELSISDRNLCKEALEAVGNTPRPGQILVPAAREGEIMRWVNLPVAEWFQKPEESFSESQVPLLNGLGFTYLFPVLLALGLMRAELSFFETISVSFHRYEKEVLLRWSQSYGLLAKFARRWEVELENNHLDLALLVADQAKGIDDPMEQDSYFEHVGYMITK
ncbi:MAG: hypothetical protein EOO38_17755, partial [Cytophagaceae bacterium]